MKNHDSDPGNLSDNQPSEKRLTEYKILPLASLHEDPANARKHGPKNLEAIRGSLLEFGQVEPLVVQKSIEADVRRRRNAADHALVGAGAVRRHLQDVRPEDADGDPANPGPAPATCSPAGFVAERHDRELPRVARASAAGGASIWLIRVAV